MIGIIYYPLEGKPGMKTELKAKLPQHLAQEKQNEDLTLIELLIALVVVGIMFLLPSPRSSTKSSRVRGNS